MVAGLLLLLGVWCTCWLGSVRLCDVILIGLGCIVEAAADFLCWLLFGLGWGGLWGLC